MSRTYRKYESYKWHANRTFYTDEEVKGLPFGTTWGWELVRVFEKQRDKKPWDKPCKSFKQLRRRQERARVKDAMAKGKEIPIFKKNDQWDWT